MANGLLSDWMSGTGVYGNPNAIDPQTGVPYADTRAAQLGALGNIGSLLIAAGQPMTGPQRAQLLGQIGPQISGMQTDIYNAAQRRLMQAQFADQMAARSARTALAEEAKADPVAFEKKYGFSPVGLPAESISSLVTKVAETNALAGPERQARSAAMAGMKAAGTVSPTQALAAGGGPTAEAGAMVGQPSGASRYQQYMAAGDSAMALGTAAGEKTAQAYYDLAEKFKPQDVKVAAGETVYRDGKPFLVGAPKPQELSTDEKNFNAAKAGGYQGSFTQFLTEKARAGSGAPQSKFEEEIDKGQAKFFTDARTAGSKAASASKDFELLDQLIALAPQGPISGSLAQKFKAFTSAGAAFESVVKRLAPQQRAEGSGSTSDIEYQGMLDSLPSLSNKPEANRLISGMAKAKFAIDKEKGQIIKDYDTGKITKAQALEKIYELDSRSIMTPELQQLISGVSGVATPVAGGQLSGSGSEFVWTPGGM